MNIIKLPGAEVNKERIPGASGGFGSTLAFYFPSPQLKVLIIAPHLRPPAPTIIAHAAHPPLFGAIMMSSQ